MASGLSANRKLSIEQFQTTNDSQAILGTERYNKLLPAQQLRVQDSRIHFSLKPY